MGLIRCSVDKDLQSKVALLAGTNAFTSLTGAPISYGTSSTALVPTVSGGSILAIYANPSACTAARYTTVRVESLLTTQTFTAQGAGLYTIRGLAGVKAAATYKGSANQGYVAGVQGKFTMAANSVLGDNNSGGIYACAMLAQVQALSGATFGTDVNLSGLWVDNQTGAAWPSASQLLNLTNNGGAMTSLVHMYGNNAVTYVLNGENLGSAKVTMTGVSSISKGLKCTFDGVTYYVPLCTSTS